MPLMREWTEITVDEDLLIPVVRELLDMAADPNQVEVVYGTSGRVILAEVHLAEHWYQERLKRAELEGLQSKESKTLIQTEVPGPAAANLDAFQEVAENVHQRGVPAQSIVPTENTAQSSTARGTEHLVSLPVKRGPGRPRKELPPSASPDGEEP